MKKFKTWLNVEPKHKAVKMLFVYLLIAFAIGLTFKIIAAGLATHRMLSLMDSRDSWKTKLDAAQVAGDPAAIGTATGHYLGFKQGVTDQSIGVYVGWAMIALKLYVYLTTFVTLYKFIYKGKQVSLKFWWFMFARFISLVLGLITGEALTIYYTTRNWESGHAISGQETFSFISPALSIVFAGVALPYIWKVIKIENRNN